MKRYLMAVAATLLSACSVTPTIESGATPADPASDTPPIRYAPVLSGTVDYRPAEPTPWAGGNETAKPGGERP
jgi:hypothetical protein